jgi:hypothetical protein
MDYFEKRLSDYADANQAVCKAKRAFIHVMYDVLSVAKIVENVKDDKSFDEVFSKYTTSTKSSIWKNIVKLSKSIKDTDKTVKTYRDTLAKPPGKVVGGGGGAAPSNVIVPDSTEDPAPVKETKAGKKTDETSGKKPLREGKNKITPAIREEIWDKYIGDKAKAKCPVCQTSDIKSTKFSAGHIIAEAHGGVTNITNLVPICGHCNSRMSTENLFEYTLNNHMRAPVFPGLDVDGCDELVVGEGKTKKGEVKKSGGGK